MNNETKQAFSKQLFTIPNILTYIRFLLIPAFIWQYCVEQDYQMTAFLLILSGITDIADGFIARHFNMSSDLGKAIDPIADKLTQFSMLGCLLTRFKQMWIPFILIFIKELISGILSFLVIKRTNRVKGADWHGKVTTVLLYIVIVLHVIWYDISQTTSMLFVSICVCMMLLSFCLYCVRHIQVLRKEQG